ncbi:aspartyl/asparaginyl beta-hydroxylase domain-containing protein [Polaribacter sp.]|uniref:aspartyl/asparaginyl beta-hydroxylase domain-containing protein n=1 Tax=Polaribacter sp. TaxID=1920175 RepID=UPI003EF6E7E8
MQKKTSYLKLPFQFHQEKLVKDLSLILDKNWISHFNTTGYNGDWKAIALYAHNGDASNILALSTRKPLLKETAILKECPYFKEVIDSFKSPIVSARLLRLGVGAEIKPHRDFELGYENDHFRIHIPIITNKDVQFILDNKLLKMLPGECWYTNVNYVHSVKNAGAIDRFHLVIDLERNNWSDKLFFSLAPEESFVPEAVNEDSPEEIKKIIEELKNVNAPVTNQLIAELEHKLAVLQKK